PTALKGKRDAEAALKPPAADPKKAAYDAAVARAQASQKGGDNAGALAAYDEALRHKPGEPTVTRLRSELGVSAYTAHGQTLLAQKKYVEAARAFDAALT